MVAIKYGVKYAGEMPPILFLRFNPNDFDGAKLSLDDRLEVLVILINHFVSSENIDNLDPHRVNVIFLYYHSKLADRVKEIESSEHLRVCDCPRL